VSDQPQTCTTCAGTGGKTVDTSSGGVQRQNWQTCGTCRGSGTRQ
jgi:DnaJ-class molecular chaperone